MHPQLLHQIADGSVMGRRRSRPVPSRRRVRRSGGAAASRLRSGIGVLLIAAGTRIAGPPEPVGLRRTPT